MKKYLIDGRFLTSLSTGVDRYAWEIIKELDVLCKNMNISLLVPASALTQDQSQQSSGRMGVQPDERSVAQILGNFQNIRVIPSKQERFWTQGVFALHARFGGYIPINLCNEVSILAPKGITALHDICYAEDNDFFSEEERQWFLKIYNRIKNHCQHVITVSEFSKRRIVELLGIPEENITVAGNGWQHFNRVDINESVFEQYPEIKKGEYYFTLASANKNKNVAWVVKNAMKSEEQGRDETYVIGGKNLNREFDFSKHKNIIYVGFLADKDAKAFMKYCKAFVFPSYYEGFGIPPLEAASVGARLIVSDRASLPEICGEAAVYINPDEADVNLEKMLQQLEDSGKAVERQKMLERYSWKKSADQVYELLKENTLKYSKEGSL